MARISLGLCLMLVVASSVIYEAQGTFLLKKYLRSRFPTKCNEFTPYANQGMIMFVTNLEGSCPATPEFKSFFTQFKSYMTFIDTASASKNMDVEMTTKCDGLFKAMSALNGGAVGKSADAGSFKATMLSMGKILVEQKKNTMMMTIAQKKTLVMAMVKWTKMIATLVKTASEKKGKTIDIAAYGLDVDVNDKSIISVTGSTESSSTKTETKTRTEGSTKKEASSSTKTEGASATKAGGSGSTATKSGSGTTFKDTTGGNAGSPSGSPTSSPSATGKTSEKAKGNAAASGSATSTTQKQSSSGSTSVKQVETQTSKEVMSFIMELEKKYSAKAELKPFFEKLKASMTASATLSSKSQQDYVAMTKAATGGLSEAMRFVGATKSAKMKSNMESCQEQLMRTLKELQDINSKIVVAKTVTSTQQTEIKQTITKWEQLTTQFVQTAASSASSTSQQSQQSQQQSSTSSQTQSNVGMVKNN